MSSGGVLEWGGVPILVALVHGVLAREGVGKKGKVFNPFYWCCEGKGQCG